MLKYSILMPYYQRIDQLYNTLLSFVHHYSDRSDWELILIEDPKNFIHSQEHKLLLEVLYEFMSKMRIVYTDLKAENIYNPCMAYNLAASHAAGSFFILTSPEVFHVTNILRGLDEEFSQTPSVYVVCASLHWQGIPQRLPSFEALRGYEIMWYQHSQYRDLQYHFCSALARENWALVDGFDEDYAHMAGYEDDDFIARIRNKRIIIHQRDDLLTYHLDHGGFPHQKISTNVEIYKSKHG